MENDICLAYTFIETSGDYNAYCDQWSRYESSPSDNVVGWQKVIKSYRKLSKYMSDEAITQAQKAVMELY